MIAPHLDTLAVGTDFSDTAAVATEHALVLAQRLDAELVFLHVCEHAREDDTLARDHVELSRQRLAALAERAIDRGVAATVHLVDGEPERRLASVAGELDADIVVVGTHGRTGLHRLFIGSVAEWTVRLSEPAVLVARDDGATHRDGYERILVPCNFSRRSIRAIDFAVRLASEDGVVDVLHCWSSPAAYPTPSGNPVPALLPTNEEVREDVLARGNRLMTDYHDAAPRVRFRERRGEPKHCIPDSLESEPYDLAVLGTRGRTGIRRWLLGSIAEATVRDAPCSVLVVGSDDG